MRTLSKLIALAVILQIVQYATTESEVPKDETLTANVDSNVEVDDDVAYVSVTSEEPDDDVTTESDLITTVSNEVTTVLTTVPPSTTPRPKQTRCAAYRYCKYKMYSK